LPNLLPFSDALPFEFAAVAMDAVLSPWHALVGRAQLGEGESPVIVGAGGLGLNAVQIGIGRGARVAVVEPREDRRAAALAHGAELAVEPGGESEIRDWAGDGGADVAYEAVGIRAGFDSAVAAVRAGGCVVCCGYRPGLEYGLDSMRLVLDEITVLGSRAGNREDARAALAAVQAGQVTPPIGLRLELGQANEAVERLRAADVPGRVVLLQ
jgi:D-arabinose 1-dehydrogenase-like Zn-dependent alcohol dehydrogenase